MNLDSANLNFLKFSRNWKSRLAKERMKGRLYHLDIILGTALKFLVNFSWISD